MKITNFRNVRDTSEGILATVTVITWFGLVENDRDIILNGRTYWKFVDNLEYTPEYQAEALYLQYKLTKNTNGTKYLIDSEEMAESEFNNRTNKIVIW